MKNDNFFEMQAVDLDRKQDLYKNRPLFQAP